MTSETERRTYGGWVRPKSFGLPGLGTLGTGVAFGVVMGGIVAMLATGWKGALAWLVLTLPALILFRYHNRAHRDGWQIVGGHVAWQWRKIRRLNSYTRGHISRVAHGVLSLPGILADSELLAAHLNGITFGIVHLKKSQHHTAILAAELDGSSLVDTITHDIWVAHFGRWMASLGAEDSLLGATVTINSSSDPGHRLSAEIDRNCPPGAANLSQRIYEDIRQRFPQGSSSVTAHIALTYTARKRLRGGGELSLQSIERHRPRDEARMGAFIAERLPAHIQALNKAGVSNVRPMTAADITELVRVAYDPNAATVIDEDRANGKPSGIRWEDAGPVGAIVGKDYFLHDGAASVTYEAIDQPQGIVESKVFEQLLAPSDRMTQKRVTFIYQTHDPADAPSIADRDRRAAFGRANSRKGEAKADDEARLEVARKTARTQRAGAGLSKLAMLATVTVTNPDDLSAAAGTLTRLGRACQLPLRPCYGVQDSAFVASIGVGVLLSEHTAMPAGLREWI